MNTFKTRPLTLMMGITVALLAACGGSGGNGSDTATVIGGNGSEAAASAPAAAAASAPSATTPPASQATASVAGFVRAAKPWAGAAVTLRCAGGQVYSTTTDNAGAFAVRTLPAVTSNALPCVLRATSASTSEFMHGWLEAAELGVVVTPLSDLTLTKAWGQDAAVGFAAYPQSGARPQVSALSDATQFAVAGLDRVSGYRSAVVGAFQDLPPDTLRPGPADSDRAQLYNALRAALAAAAWTQADLRMAAAAAASERETFADALHRRAVQARIKPTILSFNCNQPLALSTEAFECTVRGQHLTRPSRQATGNSGTALESELGLVVSRDADQDPLRIQTPGRAWKPTWCSKSQAERVVSLDTANADGPDPLGVFAEVLVFSCGGLTSTSALTAWVVADDGVASVADWPLAAGAAAWWGLPRYGLGTVASLSATCTSKDSSPDDRFHRSQATLVGSFQAYLWPGESVDAFTSSAPLSRSAVEALVLNPQLIGNPPGVPPTTGWHRNLARCQASNSADCSGQQPFNFDDLVVHTLSSTADSAAYPIYVYAAHSDGLTVRYVETQVTCPASVRKP